MFSFRESATIQCERWAEKTLFFSGNTLPKSNARAHLKQRKKHSDRNSHKKWSDPIIIFQVIAFKKNLKLNKTKMDAIASFLVKHDRGQMPIDPETPKTYINYTRFRGNSDHCWKTENLIRSSPYSWVTLHTKLDRSNNYFSSYRVNKIFWESLTLALGKKNCWRGSLFL